MSKFLRLLIFPVIMLSLIAGCSSDDDNPIDTGGAGDGNGGYTAMLDASNDANYAYYNFETMETVDITDAEAASSNDWHIAFSRMNGKLNGGDAGPLGVRGVDLFDLGDPNAMDFDAVTALPNIADSLWETDMINLVLTDWWWYTGSPQHDIRATENLFVMQDVTGNGYAKVVIDSIIGETTSHIGNVYIKFVFNPSGADLSGQTQTAMVDGSSGDAYFSFAAGGQINVADRMTSTEWDFRIISVPADPRTYWIEINNSIHGPGSATVYPMYLESNDFDALLAAPQGGGYFTDGIQSCFGAPTIPGSEWYDYNPVVHEIVSKEHVYIVSVPGDVYYKLQITNYYRVVDGQAYSGWITMRFREF